MNELETCLNRLKGMLAAGAVDPRKAPVAFLLVRIVILQDEKIKQLEEANANGFSVGPAL